jgi:DNA-binding beta-propeller fold protein YncE
VSKLIAFALAAAALTLCSNAADAYKWTVQYLIDNSQAVFGRTQKNWPRHNRGLAISPDGKYLYAGYNHSFEGQGEVRKISVAVADYERATVASIPGAMGKAIATDDKGRVYIANTNELLIYDANLEQRQARVITGVSDGVAVARDGASLILFTSDRGKA